VVLGSTAGRLAQHAEVPLLIARRTIDADNFPQSVLLATDGSDGSMAPARVATRLAKARGSSLRLVYVPDGRGAERYREVLKQQALIELITGSSPKIAEDSGHVADRICDEAKGYRASMIVIARRGLGWGQGAWQRQRAGAPPRAMLGPRGCQRDRAKVVKI
jgi:nucleotide-binding universal stress UspA family protein